MKSGGARIASAINVPAVNRFQGGDILEQKLAWGRYRSLQKDDGCRVAPMQGMAHQREDENYLLQRACRSWISQSHAMDVDAEASWKD